MIIKIKVIEGRRGGKSKRFSPPVERKIGSEVEVEEDELYVCFTKTYSYRCLKKVEREFHLPVMLI